MTNQNTAPRNANVGDIKACYAKSIQSALDQNPGWAQCDGTHTLPDGSVPPDMRGKMIIGADGSTYAVGGTGGSATQGNHTVTDPSAHPVLQHDHNHTSASDNLAAGTSINFTGAGSLSVLTSGHTHTAHADHASMGHTGTAVSIHGTNLPPYGAFWILLYMGR